LQADITMPGGIEGIVSENDGKDYNCNIRSQAGKMEPVHFVLSSRFGPSADNVYSLDEK
jgi:hypothetical protein